MYLSGNYDFTQAVLAQEEMKSLERPKQSLNLAIGIVVQQRILTGPLNIDSVGFGEMIARELRFMNGKS